MANLFGLYERSGSYDKRLEAIVDGNKLKITEADVKAIRCLREDRDRLLELVERFQRLRARQLEVDKYNRAGVKTAPGLETAMIDAARLAPECDAQIFATLDGLNK